MVARAAAATGTLSVVGAAAFCRGVRVLGEALAGESLFGGGFGTALDAVSGTSPSWPTTTTGSWGSRTPSSERHGRLGTG